MPFQAFAYLDINHPVVAWGVYRGILVSAQVNYAPQTFPVSMMFAGIVHYRNNVRFQNELLIDSIRIQRFPNQVSRLEGMYFFTDLGQAREAITQRWGAHFCQENLAELEVHPHAKMTRVDSNWVTRAKQCPDGRIDEADLSWIDRYWAGESRGSFPAWETIVHGRAVIFGTDLRKRAYEVIAKAFPTALDTLEVSRLAAEVGSDLGQCAAFITQPIPGTFRLAYYLDMRDAENPEFRKRLAGYDGPKNLGDLAPGKETFSLPDFRPYFTDFTVSQTPNANGVTIVSSLHKSLTGI